MKTRTTEVKNYIVEWICECGGLMEDTGEWLEVTPPKFLHKCNTCDKTDYCQEQYPHAKLEYVEAE
jgi:hypothetical protein